MLVILPLCIHLFHGLSETPWLSATKGINHLSPQPRSERRRHAASIRWLDAGKLRPVAHGRSFLVDTKGAVSPSLTPIYAAREGPGGARRMASRCWSDRATSEPAPPSARDLELERHPDRDDARQYVELLHCLSAARHGLADG